MEDTLRLLIAESLPSLRERIWEFKDGNHTERSVHMLAFLKNFLVLGWNHGLDRWTELLIISKDILTVKSEIEFFINMFD